MSPYGNKVKITTKDGKQVDLEKKVGSAASSASVTPVASPAPSTASVHKPAPVVSTPAGSTSATPPASALSAPAPASAASSPAKLTIAEEFRRKILERAKAAQKEKELKEKKEKGEEQAEEKAGEKAEATNTPVETKEPEPKEEEAKVKEEPKEEPKEEVKEVEEDKAVKEDAAESAEPSTEVPEAAPVSQVDEPEQVQQISEKAVEEAAEPTPAVPVPAALKENVNEDVAPIAPAVEKQEEQAPGTPETAPETAPTTTSAPETATETETKEEKEEADASNDEGADDDEEGEGEEEEDGLDLSQFFQRLQEVKPIEDPYSMTYPEPFTGVDPKWKSEKAFRYDPQFLIQFKDVVQFPIDEEFKNKLESLGITAGRKAPQGGRGGLNRFGAGGARFGPGMGNRGQFSDPRQNSRNGSRRRGGSSGGPSRDKSTRRGAPSRRGGRDHKDDGITIPPEEIKPLEKSSNRWVPKPRGAKTEVKLAPDGTEIYSEEDIERKVKSQLNKLTLEMFEPISDAILKLGNQSKWEDDAKTVRQIISLTFAKACDEPYWSSMYAQFCAKMCTQMSDEIKDVNIRLKNGDCARGGDLARRILLTTCQTEYEKGWSDKLPTNEDGTPIEPEMMSDEYYAMAAAKRRGLGLVKFIGHLYILNMLNDQVILLCLRDQSSNVKDPSEDSLENLAQLVTTVGARLETTEKNRAVLNIVFDNIQTILDNCKLSSRIKFKLMDLQDLRASKWKSAKADAGPKTIQEIHEDAEIKKLEDERAAIERRRKNKTESRSNSSKIGSSWGSSPALKKDPRAPKDSRGFTAVQPRSQSSRQNLASPVDSANTSGNTVSPRENSKRSESIQSAANMFAALGGEEDD